VSGAAPDGVSAAELRLDWRPFRFVLPRAMVTAHGSLAQKRGWLLRLRHADGRTGWGEAAWLEAAPTAPSTAAPTASAAPALLPPPPGPVWSRAGLEALLPSLATPLAFAIGQALAELDGLGGSAGGSWLPAPASALLLPAGDAGPEALRRALATVPPPPAVKWKVAALPDALEREALERLLALLPIASRLRLDANGGWDRPTATAWADRLAADPRLEWLEQPLAPEDGDGLQALVRRVPVALDESLRSPAPAPDPWPGWRVCRPALAGDPRPLLGALAAGSPRLMISTALETGIGARLVAHLAALQQRGPTPTAPGLAPGWRPEGGLFSADPARVWEAAA
jgi:O-succinylbenzoate synthase